MEDLEQQQQQQPQQQQSHYHQQQQEQQVVVESFVIATPSDQKLIPRNRIFLDGSYITSPSLSSLRSISSSSSSSLTTAYILPSSVPNIELVRSNDHSIGNDIKDDINCHVQTKRLSRRSFRKFFSFSLTSSSSSSSSSFVTTVLGLAILTWIGAFLVEFGVDDDSRQLRSNRVMKNNTYFQMDEFVDMTKTNTPKEDTTISSIFLSLSNFSLGYFEANHVLDLFLQVQRDIYSSMEKIEEEVKVGNYDNKTISLEEGKNVTGSHVEIIVVEDSWQSRNTTTQVVA